MLINRDPAARLAVLSAANKAIFGSTRCDSVNVAIQRLGTQNTVMRLMSLWSLDELNVSAAAQACRRWMCLRSVSFFATVKRMLDALREQQDPLALQLFVLNDLMAFASALSVHETEAALQERLIAHSRQQTTHLHFDELLQPLQLRGCLIAQAWQIPESVQKWLRAMLHIETDTAAQLPLPVQALLLTEILHSEHTLVEACEHQDRMEALFEALPLVQKLLERQIRMADLVVHV